MSSAILVLTLVAALGCGVASGFFFAFSFVVMPALGRLPGPHGIAAMQQINVVALKPWLMTELFGTAAVCVAAIVAGLAHWGDSYAVYLIAGGAIYLLGAIGVTMAFNVPRNIALERVEPATPEAAKLWARYLVEWTAWNHVRTLAPLIASGLLIAAIRVG
jgi:uncharacterized membrane protein